MRLPIRARLALLSSALIAIVLVVFGTFLYLRLSASLLETADVGLRSRAAALVGDASTLRAGATGLAEPEEALVQVLDVEGRVVESSADIPTTALLPSAVTTGLRGAATFTREVEIGGETIPVRLLAVPAPDDRIVIVGTSLEDQDEAKAELLSLLLVGGPLAAILAGGVGWLVTGAALRPVDRMRRDAEAISGTGRGLRLAALPPTDELGRLAESLNHMLARLEHAAQRERRFVDDASHELRTPLTNLRAELDLALRRPRTAEALYAALGSAAEETERLMRLAEDMLVLARAEQGQLVVRRENTDATALVRDVAATFNVRAAERGVTIVLPERISLHAWLDPPRLRQAVGNLVDNALRHAVAGGRVEVSVSVGASDLVIAVSDDGPGFAPDLLTRAFEPFTRSDPGRARAAGGTGLGLAIVEAVAVAHGGSVEASNLPGGGAIVTLRVRTVAPAVAPG